MSTTYPDTGEPYHEGDRLSEDGHLGTLRRVCVAGSQDAQDYHCAVTGGLLIEFDEYGLVLVPFDTVHEIKLLARSGGTPE